MCVFKRKLSMSTEKKSKSTKNKKSSSKDKVKSTKSKPKKDDTAVAQLCKGKTSKGEACSRKGIHDGYCYQHSPNAVKDKTVTEGTKPTKLKVNTKTGKLSYKGMIGRAIVADADKKGSSRQAIKKYLRANFKVEKKDWFRVNSAIAKMLESEEIAKNPKHQGHFKLTPDFRKLVESS